MNEIKFRAWHIEDKFMFIPRRIDFPHFMIGDTAKWEVWYQFEDEDDSTPEHFPLEDISFSGDELEIMQYTGLKDRNGKEICEGDIIETRSELIRIVDETRTGRYSIEKKEVIYDAPSFKFLDSRFPLSVDGCKKYYTVIGNVCENPELLEGK